MVLRKVLKKTLLIGSIINHVSPPDSKLRMDYTHLRWISAPQLGKVRVDFQI